MNPYRFGNIVTLFIAIVSFAGSSQAVTETVIHTFAGSDGASPFSAMVADSSGNLFGTTRQGGTFGKGTVFELTNAGGSWSEVVLHSFSGSPDGQDPIGGLIFDKAGNLFGTASGGGNSQNEGIVFELSPSDNGWTETIIYNFGNNLGDGCNPQTNLALDSAGNFYGTTYDCANGNGTVFELTLSDGHWTETTLSAFNSSTGAGVVLDPAGNIYGSTSGGGNFGQGLVFKLTQTSGLWTETSIFSFTGGDNGCTPYGGVTLDKRGNLYGTTFGCGADNAGTVFKLTPALGEWTMTVLHIFTGSRDGASPYAQLLLGPGGELFGTGSAGGRYGYGVVFSLAPKSSNWIETKYGFMSGDDGALPFSGVTIDKSVLYGTTWSGGSNGLGTVYMVTAN
jgi:uncharacterized repeat protein (TIGR03803 family)